METIQKTTRGSGNIFPPPLKPYDWQVPIIKVMIDTILAGKNGLVLQPTATGKSVEAAFAARACILLHGKRGIYLYDENEGLEQARKRFEYIFGQNEVKYANFFGYGKDHGLIDDADIVFASFQSLNNHHEKWYQAFDPTRFDFMIVNEAHGGQAVTYKEVIDYFQCSKIGMTATPDRMDGKDILEIFETVIFEMTLEEAIVKGRVAQIEYHIKSHGLSTQRLKKICHEVLEEGKRIAISQLNETIFIDALDDEVFKEIYACAFPTDGDPRQTLLFCENIAHANRVAERIKRDGYNVEAIHSHYGKGHNRKSMQYFREGKIQFLVSINKLNEDIDVPNVEVAAFLRATDSLTVFFQQLGRTLRKTLYKHKAIILDFVANVERMMLVADLMRRVKNAEEKFKLADGLPLQKDPLHVTGAGFEFLLTNEVVDMMKVLERIREGFYETWQEASKVCVEAQVLSSGDYQERYLAIDPRLPSNPNVTFPNFPGWPIFLNKKQPSSGWKTLTALTFKGGQNVSIRDFAEQFRGEHPDWFEDFCAGNGSSHEHYSPHLVALIKDEFKKRQWILNATLAKELSCSRTTIANYAEQFQEKHPEWIHEVNNGRSKRRHYHPTLEKKILQKFKGLILEEGWLNTKQLIDEIGNVGHPMIANFTEQFRKKHSDWFKEIPHKGICFSPILCEKIRKKFSGREIAPKDWHTRLHIVRSLRLTNFQFNEVLNYFKEIGENDHKIYLTNNGHLIEHYSPKVFALIRGTLKRPPQGWLDLIQIAKEIGGRKINLIKKELESHRAAHPKDINIFKMGDLAGRSSLMRECYSPVLVQLIKQKFKTKNK